MLPASAAVDANRAPQTDDFLLHNTKDSDELQNGSSFYDTGCGHHQTIEDTDGESLQHYHDAVGGDHVFEVNGGGTPVSLEKCDNSNDKVTAYEPCQVTYVMSDAKDEARDDVYEKCAHLLSENEKCEHSASPEATSFKVNKNNGAEVADNQLGLPTECVVLHNTLEGTDKSPCDDSNAHMHKRIHEEVSSMDNQDMKDPESRVARLNVQTLCGSESSIEFVVAPDVHNFELEKTELNLHQKEKAELSDSVDATSSKDLADVILVTKEESMPNSVVTASGQICSIDLLEDMMTEAKSNKVLFI